MTNPNRYNFVVNNEPMTAVEKAVESGGLIENLNRIVDEFKAHNKGETEGFAMYLRVRIYRKLWELLSLQVKPKENGFNVIMLNGMPALQGEYSQTTPVDFVHRDVTNAIFLDDPGKRWSDFEPEKFSEWSVWR
jgi:hypothetical protein